MEADRNPICGKGDKIGDDQFTEEEKMEKFFALIRNYKETRDGQRIVMEKLPAAEESDDDEDRMRNKKKSKLGDQNQPSWIPAFKLEDFTENVQTELRRSPAIDLPASNSDENYKIISMQRNTKGSPPVDVDSNGLDLKLRL